MPTGKGFQHALWGDLSDPLYIVYLVPPHSNGEVPRRGGGVRALIERCKNRIEYRLDPRHHFAIPETQDLEARRIQEPIPAQVVVQAFRMLTAVDLDDEQRLQTYEIADVEANLMLPSELEA